MDIFSKKFDTVAKAHYTITFLIIISILIAIVKAIIQMDFIIVFVSTLTLMILVMPVLIQKRYEIKLPLGFQFTLTVFVYASIFLGEVHGYYAKFWWWDIILHTGSGISLGFIGFAIMYLLYAKEKIKANPWALALFAFCFAIALGTIWEIFEFTMDSFFGLNMQKSGLIDTMWDLIVDGLGALFASAVGFIYFKEKKNNFFKKTLKRFWNENKKLFH